MAKRRNAIVQKRLQPSRIEKLPRLTNLYNDIFGTYNYRVIIPSIITLIGAYFGLYSIVEARYERRLNQAGFERAAFTDLVTSNNRGAFIAAMKRFGPIQNMEVPPEPHLWPPWKPLEWFGKPKKPNKQILYTWAIYYLPECTPKLCGHKKASQGFPKKDVRIDLNVANLYDTRLTGVDLNNADLIGANLGLAHLWEVNLSGANLVGADLRGADLSRANLSDANLDNVKYDSYTVWPNGFTPPSR